jgi:predicted phage terminase large subunit-like protein
MQKIIKPQEGAQERFLESEADIAIYAGPRGTGKSYAGLLSLLTCVGTKGFGGVILRREYPQLVGPGSVFEESKGLYPIAGGTYVSSPYPLWTFPSNATVLFSSLQYDEDIKNHQGKQYAQIMFEELTQFTETQFWGMYASCRSTCGIKPYMRATTNPEPGWVADLIDWWIDPDGLIYPERSGVIRWIVRDEAGKIKYYESKEEAIIMNKKKVYPISLTVIRATLEENKALLEKDPDYIGRLAGLPPVERARWLEGNWKTKEQGDRFQRSWFKIIDSPPDNIIARVRSWDIAYTQPHEGNKDPDWTRGALVSLTSNGDFIIEHIISTRSTPGVVKGMIESMANIDGHGVTVVLPHDPAAGAYVVDDLKRTLNGFAVKSTIIKSNKIAYADIWAAHAERGKVFLVNGFWIEDFLKELDSFPKGKHDDQVDAISLAVMSLPKGESSAYVPASYRQSAASNDNQFGDMNKTGNKYVMGIITKKPWGSL